MYVYKTILTKHDPQMTNYSKKKKKILCGEDTTQNAIVYKEGGS